MSISLLILIIVLSFSPSAALAIHADNTTSNGREL